jgi:hypothetical protein
VGGAAAGANSDGWRFDPPTRGFVPDHLATGTVGFQAGGAAAALDPAGP